MQFDDQFIIIMDGLPLHGSPTADIFPIMVEPAPGEAISNQDLADLMEKRLEDPVLTFKRFPKIQLSPRNSGAEVVESD